MLDGKCTKRRAANIFDKVPESSFLSCRKTVTKGKWSNCGSRRSRPGSTVHSGGFNNRILLQFFQFHSDQRDTFCVTELYRSECTLPDAVGDSYLRQHSTWVSSSLQMFITEIM